MRKMTEANLNTAYAGESMAHMRYGIYADVADSEGKPNIARLFRSKMRHPTDVLFARQQRTNSGISEVFELARMEDVWPTE